MTREATQEDGREGVILTKRWLEATTHIELPFNAYENPMPCLVDHLNQTNDGFKQFDLAGFFLGENRRPLVVENKAANADNGQYQEYLEFLAIAYSSTLREREMYKKDFGREFMWVTTHPFTIGKWKDFHQPSTVLDALSSHSAYIPGREPDHELAALIASRVWVLLLNVKQDALSLTHDELMEVHTVLPRKKPTL